MDVDLGSLTTDRSVVIEATDEILEILKSPRFEVVRGKEPEVSRGLLAGTIGAIDGPEHFQRRRFESRVLTNEALAYFEMRSLHPIIDQSLHQVQRRGRGDDGLYRADLVELMVEILYGVGASVAGVDGVDTRAEIADFNRLIDTVTAGATVEWSTRDADLVVREAEQGLAELRAKYIDRSLARRWELAQGLESGSVSPEELPRDILMQLVLNWQDHWDEGLPAREVAVYLNASTRTTARISPHIIAHVHQWQKVKGLSPEEVATGHFLRRAAAEALRLHTIVPAFMRRATVPVTLASGRSLQAGDVAVLDFRQANRDEALYGPTANEFDPGRVEQLPDGVMPWGMSFGGGVHMCIGRRMVTGGDLLREDASQERDGTLVAILKRLYACGIAPDGRSSASPNTDSYYDGYESFPVTFTSL